MLDLLLKGACAHFSDLPISHTTREQVRHIVHTRASWLYNLMGEGDPDIEAIAAWGYEGDIPSTAELVRGLKVTFSAWRECLERWRLEDLEYVFIA